METLQRLTSGDTNVLPAAVASELSSLLAVVRAFAEGKITEIQADSTLRPPIDGQCICATALFQVASGAETLRHALQAASL